MDNVSLAGRLDAFAALLELNGSSFYTVRAYRRAAELIRSTPADVDALVRAGRARELAGIGSGIEARLRELVETGELAELRELEAEAMPELVGVSRLLGLSPKRMRELGSALGVRTLEGLREAAAAGRLESVPGIGPKTAERIRTGLEPTSAPPRPQRGMLLNRARALVGEIATALGGEPAGDPRRWCELSTRFAVVVPSDTVLLGVESLPQVLAVLERGERRVVCVTTEGHPVEIVAAAPERLGTELVRATGSAAYVTSLGELPEAATEEELYALLGRPYRPPELRELDAADPADDLLRLEDVRGDLHVHSTASDGKATVLEMGLAARERGYEYLAICDHTKAVRVVEGLDAEGLRRQAEEIAAANEELAPFRVLRGSECDILPDG
ncbi:MAG TPA: helix-hairpin-helix domain-containing protein, partial [Gaiellaceae bacterium]|nr:helix-hairpin-helix domain-containing protein [Gaiellaceae bacterium]